MVLKNRALLLELLDAGSHGPFDALADPARSTLFAGHFLALLPKCARHAHRKRHHGFAVLVDRLAMGDALAVCLMELRNFTAEDFAQYHPGGALGKKLLLRVSAMLEHTLKPMVSPNAPIKKVIFEKRNSVYREKQNRLVIWHNRTKPRKCLINLGFKCAILPNWAQIAPHGFEVFRTLSKFDTNWPCIRPHDGFIVRRYTAY